MAAPFFNFNRNGLILLQFKPTLSLSSVSVWLPDTRLSLGQLWQQRRQAIPNWRENQLQHPLYALYEEYGLPLDGSPLPSAKESEWGDTKLPVSFTPGGAELALAAVRQLLATCNPTRPTVKYLLYGHETLEPSITLTPTQKIKKILKLKHTLPFSVCGQGSITVASALRMLHVLEQTDGQAGERLPSLLVTTDQVCPPQPRAFFQQFPKGDSAAACLVAPDEGEWTILDCQFHHWALHHPNPYHWTINDYHQHEATFYKQLTALLPDFLSKNDIGFRDLEWLVPQHLSERFFQETACLAQGACRLYRRELLPECNLLNSDCLISLHELDTGKQVSRGSFVLLVPAGPLASLGFVLLQKNKKE
ncbi:hypothetical protein [Brevibacillus fulvus]|uniref:3-oxoacyl-ACP synthase n=1 Tax=Brevibacillus fulvus TaxID=1125967 RepID=A0A939BUJ6_9BACL|nr:hypothetical protein [Brevibacillus fulvus]